MKSIKYKLTELILLFIVIPFSFLWTYSIWIKISLGLFGFIYVIYVLLKVEKKTFSLASHLNWKQFLKETIIKLLIIVIVTIFYMWFVDKDNLFKVFLAKPLLWVSILFIYSFFSVYPQELIYRTFFFQRYQTLFKTEWVFIITNALLFSIAHIFFKKSLVLFLTFIGGILFALTFRKTKSTLLVSIEHAVYGSWLFTVGMGNMLGFPS